MQELETNNGKEKSLDEVHEDNVEHFTHDTESATEYIYSEELKELREEVWNQKK